MRNRKRQRELRRQNRRLKWQNAEKERQEERFESKSWVSMSSDNYTDLSKRVYGSFGSSTK